MKLYQNKNQDSLKTSQYKCNCCKDTGWILVSKENSAPLAVSCECRELAKQRSEWIASGIDPEDSALTFSNFSVWNESSRKAKETAIKFYQNFDSIRNLRNNSILFCGQAGSGKSHLCVALAFNFMRKDIRVVYMPYRTVITDLKQNLMDDYKGYKKMILRYQECEVLLIDDLFKGKINDSDINIVFEILNHRYINRLPIIVSTEFSTRKLIDYDEAIGSRIYEMCRDYRVEIEKIRDNNYRLRKVN